MGYDQETICGGSLRGEALLQQHRALMELIERLAECLDRLEANEPGDDGPKEVNLLLERLILALETHFTAERASLDRDFGDEPRLQDQLLILDEEHPLLLAAFMRARSTALDGVDKQRLCVELGTAIDRFREHEAEEDVLFASE
jgi:hypothetical protein